ncbi:MAG: hypothetical protein FWD05_06190, partial [Oscillospiraceae bacterium]|nr:hypothetical protein [Oscillospiraceae bacterium]
SDVSELGEVLVSNAFAPMHSGGVLGFVECDSGTNYVPCTDDNNDTGNAGENDADNAGNNNAGNADNNNAGNAGNSNAGNTGNNNVGNARNNMNNANISAPPANLQEAPAAEFAETMSTLSGEIGLIAETIYNQTDLNINETAIPQSDIIDTQSLVGQSNQPESDMQSNMLLSIGLVALAMLTMTGFFVRHKAGKQKRD